MRVQKPKATDTAVSFTAAPAVAKIVGQDVVAGVAQMAKLREKVDLEAAGIFPVFR